MSQIVVSPVRVNGKEIEVGHLAPFGDKRSTTLGLSYIMPSFMQKRQIAGKHLFMNGNYLHITECFFLQIKWHHKFTLTKI